MPMSHTLKAELLPTLQARDVRPSRERKSGRRDALCEAPGHERECAMKLLCDTRSAPSGGAHPGPEPRYGPIVRTV